MTPMKRLERSLILSGLIFGMTALLPSQVSAAEEDSRECAASRVITTSGHGEVRVPPDSLRVSVGVDVQAAALDEARDKAATEMQAVTSALHGLEIPNLT